MKHFNKIYFVFSVLLLGLLASCEQENIGPKYESKEGLTFVNKALNAATVDPNNTKFTVDLFRSDASVALSGPVTFKAVLPNKTELSGVTVSDYSFAVGEAKTLITVDVNPLPIGVVLDLTLTIPEELASVNGITTTNIKVNKAYIWESLGKGTFLDNWSSGVEYPVEILKADGFDRYRVLNPYVETLKNDDGEWGDWIATSSAPYIEFWTTENNLVSYSRFFLGLNYQADDKQPIYAYHPSSFANIGVTFNKWIDSKTVQLAPYFYIDGVGGWNQTQKNDQIIIKLP